MRLSHSAALAVLAALAVALFAVVNIASAAPSLVVTIDDTDNIVKAGSSKLVSVQVTGESGGEAYTELNFVIGSAGIVVDALSVADGDIDNDFFDSPTGVTPNVTGAAPTPKVVANVVFPPNADGEYTISARVTRGSGNDAEVLDGSMTVRVGDPGTNIASAEISLGKVGHSAARTAGTDTSSAPAHPAISSTDADNDGAPDGYTDCAISGADNTKVTGDESLDTEVIPDTDPQETYDASLSSCIALTVTVKNSLGELANKDEITAIDVYAPLATVIFDAAGTTTSANGYDNDGSAQVADSANSVKFFIAKPAAGTVPVTAFVRGKTGFASAVAFDLTFTGSADSISVGEADSALSQTGTAFEDAEPGVDANTDGDFADIGDTAPVAEVPSEGEARIEVTAVDKAGNVATLSDDDINVEIFDADDELYSKIIPTVTQQVNAKGSEVHTALRITLRGEEAAPGTYTVKVTFGDNDPEEATVVVAGDVASVDLVVSESTVSIGDIITVTATVTDADGNVSPDVGEVDFQAVGALKLNALGKGADEGSVSMAVDDGEAEARFVVVSGSGTSTIIASLSGVDGVTAVSTEAADAMPEEEASVACLSNLAGFATWACGVESSASEIFGLVSGRGATALHLWNGSAWVRYSVVDGTMVPGSSDFMVAENDILYISN